MPVRYGCVQGWEESSQYSHYYKLDYTAGSGDLIFLCEQLIYSVVAKINISEFVLLLQNTIVPL